MQGGLVVLVLLALVCQCYSQNVTVTCQSGKYPPEEKNKVPTYVINLDLPPAQRWAEIVQAKTAEIKSLLEVFKNFLKAWGKVGQALLDFLEANVDKMDQTLPYPFAQEIMGMSNATGIPLSEMVLFNLFYEFSNLCTSVVAEDPSGKLFHARNLDFGSFMGWDPKTDEWYIAENLRNLVVNLDWQRGGKTVFKSVNFAGYTGIITGIKPNTFTLSVNAREGKSIDGVIRWLEGYRNESWMGFLTRAVFENETSVEAARQRLEDREMIVPVYFILGGTKSGEGYVITRDPEGTVDTWLMMDAFKWFILQTNYDHWNNPPFIDDRRDAADFCMEKHTGQANISFAGIFDMLSTQPVLNKATTYTALMQVDAGTLETYLRDCKDPCPPF